MPPQELADFLMLLGFSNRDARFLAVVATLSTCTVRDIITHAGLTEPKISLAAKDMRSQGYVSLERRKPTGSKHSRFMYTLNREAFEATIKERRRRIEARFDDALRYTQTTPTPVATT